MAQPNRFQPTESTEQSTTPQAPADLVEKISESSLESRRSFLRRSAAAGAGTLALAFAGSNAALANSNQSGDDVNVDDATDVEVLQFALTLEHLENAFYRDVGGSFSKSDYMSAKFLEGFGSRVRKDVVENFQDIGEHERVHVVTLENVLEELGADPVSEANYDFGVDSVDDFVEVARILENTGVSAYTGSIGDVESTPLKTAGATIATVEARHASYLNFLTGEDPFPAAFDDPKSRKTILDAASGFIED